MTKITLEDVAVECEDDGFNEHAALCRSAQAVIDAARQCRAGEQFAFGPLWDALAAHAKNEQGTGEGG